MLIQLKGHWFFFAQPAKQQVKKKTGFASMRI
jgi:hypothetical protein